MNNVEMVFGDEHENLVVIMPSALRRFYIYKQLKRESSEAGGVLIGERRGQHIVIWDISEPGIGDKRSRYSFDRLGKHHQKKINDAYSHSSGKMQYLGEWHTHPEDHPKPSIIDKNTWHNHLPVILPMIVIIIGRESIWLAKKTKGNICTMKLVET
ncbi:MAG: CBASS system CD-NTase/cGAS isopeptidase Cap3 [Marinomonas sp.]|uniref:CBASS system CD-NTase/cGAS isopeptidase Cap3 n=1 Tax=Marinomonas sp. TaxID=1904862 RepID=UPI003F970FF3